MQSSYQPSYPQTASAPSQVAPVQSEQAAYQSSYYAQNGYPNYAGYYNEYEYSQMYYGQYKQEAPAPAATEEKKQEAPAEMEVEKVEPKNTKARDINGPFIKELMRLVS